MLVNAGEKECRPPAQPLVAREDVRENFFIGMAYVRSRVRVIDRGRVEGAFRHSDNKIKRL